MALFFNLSGLIKRRLRRKSKAMDAQMNTDVVVHNICVYLCSSVVPTKIY
jgi:hypothetical protein